MTTTRTENIHKSFEKVADLAFQNIPDDIACSVLVYIRDKATWENWGDWTIDIRAICKNMTYYDWASVKEYVNHKALEL